MRLLVSPSSLEEAARSLAADIIDVKRPAEGSLGANFPWVIRAIRDLTDKPVSAAIGDFDFRPGGAALAAYGAACAGADYVKVGLLFDGEDRARELIRAVVRGVKGEFPSKAVVIAAYADYARLSTISPMAMAPLAAECGADVAMIDTAIKDGKRLFDHMDEEALAEFTAGNRRLGLETALAGSLRFDDIPLLKRIGPEIIGVRGMVCGGDRSSTIRAELVEKARAMVVG
ncbi:MAG: (5-formylfuran-3-yl)methyl phosphate synthase [Methanomicrobiales archaeon]|nr:(5-formylfuran-3-yl)methyl phosphate synthase [Methanomicrobiales archaeon]